MIDPRAAASPPASQEVHTFYPYFQPSQAAAAIFCALFSIGALVSIWQTFRYKSWIWMVMIIAVLMEAIGYGARVVSAGNVTARTVYIIQYCLVILAPVLMAGVIYVVFGRIVFLVVPPQARTVRLLWVPARWIAPIFVTFDIFALFLQLVGSIVLTGVDVTDPNAAKKLQLGKDIALSGVSIQIIAFGLFSFVAARFHFTSTRFREELARRFQAVPGDKFVTLEGNGRKFRPNWRNLLYVVNASCVIILIRSVYREIDFSMGKDSPMSKYEWYPYVFDAVPMFVVVALYTLCPPGAYVSMGWRQPRSEEAQDVQMVAPGSSQSWPDQPRRA